jgi:nitric oxide dioxygenase
MIKAQGLGAATCSIQNAIGATPPRDKLGVDPARLRNRSKDTAMTPNQIKLVQTSFAQVAPMADTVANLFYGRLFEIAPHVRSMFPEDLTEQKKKLMVMLGTTVAGLSHLDTLVPTVRALGRRHAGYGVKPHHFAPVGSALLWTLGKGLGTAFTPEVKDAWATAYILLSTTMIDAANERPMAA